MLSELYLTFLKRLNKKKVQMSPYYYREAFEHMAYCQCSAASVQYGKARGLQNNSVPFSQLSSMAWSLCI